MTHVNDVMKDQQYEEFFMKGKNTKKRLRLGAASVIDEVLLGRDTDYSGEDPHKEFMNNFGDHAGLKSAQQEDRPCRQHGYALSSTMDSLIWGRDFDKSGAGAHETFAKVFSDSAGSKSQERPDRPFRKGCYSMSSVMDNVIWGRDFDQSGEDPYQNFAETFSGFAGVAAGGRPVRPFRKPAFTNNSVMTTVLTGRQSGAKLDDPHEKFMEQYGNHAGLKAKHKVFKPFRKQGMSMKSGADTLIWGRDVDMSGHDFHQGQHFGATFADHAGRTHIPGRPRSEKAELKRSASAPPPSSGGASGAAEPPKQGARDKPKQEKKTPRPRKDKAADAGGHLAFKPASRGSSVGSLTARSNQSEPKSTGRSTSAGSLTSRSRRSGSAGSATARSGQSASAGSLTARSQLTLQSARSASVGSLTGRPSRGPGAHVSTPAPRKAPSCAGSAASTTSRDYGQGCARPGSGGGGRPTAPATAPKPAAPSKQAGPSKPVAPSSSRAASAPAPKPRRSSSNESRPSRPSCAAQPPTSRSHRSRWSGSETARSHKSRESGSETARSHKSRESGAETARSHKSRESGSVAARR